MLFRQLDFPLDPTTFNELLCAMDQHEPYGHVTEDEFRQFFAPPAGASFARKHPAVGTIDFVRAAGDIQLELGYNMSWINLDPAKLTATTEEYQKCQQNRKMVELDELDGTLMPSMKAWSALANLLDKRDLHLQRSGQNRVAWRLMQTPLENRPAWLRMRLLHHQGRATGFRVKAARPLT